MRKKGGTVCLSLSLCLSAGMIKQFLRDVDWGEVDYLIVDTPPGTSDEHLSAVQYLSAAHIDGAVIITTPQVSERPGGLAALGRVRTFLSRTASRPFSRSSSSEHVPQQPCVDRQKLC